MPYLPRRHVIGRICTLALSLSLAVAAGAQTAPPVGDDPLKALREASGGGVKAPPAPAPAPAAPSDETAASDLLGEPFESQVAGITFRPPAGCKSIKKSDPDDIVEYIHDQKQWLLKVTRARLSQPMPLQTVTEKGVQRIGLLDFTVQDIQKDHPAAEVMRNEIVNVGEYGVGLAIVRLNIGNQRFLRQQAIFQSNEQLYYIFNLTSPAARTGRPEDDANERSAAHTFKAMLDTIQLLDRAWIKKDQVNRLFRTRALFVDWSDKGRQKIKDAIIPRQWFRLVRDGKDVGYSYIVESFLEGRDVKNNPARAYDGVLVSIRSRTVDKAKNEAGKEVINQVDIGSQMFVSLDRKHEDWAHVVNMVANKGAKDENRTQTQEFGYSELKRMRTVDKGAPLGDDKDKRNPAVREIESYELRVQRQTRGRNPNTNPDQHTPAPWYVPQAVGSMLPRLVPPNKPVTYLFQTYVSDSKEVIHRYVDVGFEKDVMIGGKKYRAVPISDRVRLEGAPTVHYIGLDGKYLGSINEEARVMILPATEAEIKAIWKDAELEKPGELELPPNLRGTPGSGSLSNTPRSTTPTRN